MSGSKICQHIWSCIFNNKQDLKELKRYGGNENHWHKANENSYVAISAGLFRGKTRQKHTFIEVRTTYIISSFWPFYEYLYLV